MLDPEATDPHIFALDQAIGYANTNAVAAGIYATENAKLRIALINLTLEAMHYMEHGYGKTHLKDSIARANAALAAPKG